METIQSLRLDINKLQGTVEEQQRQVCRIDMRMDHLEMGFDEKIAKKVGDLTPPITHSMQAKGKLQQLESHQACDLAWRLLILLMTVPFHSLMAVTATATGCQRSHWTTTCKCNVYLSIR